MNCKICKNSCDCNEIIKALKIYIACYGREIRVDDNVRIGDIYDLINHLQAENEELEKEIDQQYEQAQADILGNIADGGTSCHWCIAQHKAEAYKEFAERLKQVFWSKAECDFLIRGIVDNLLKELVGDNNA